MHISLPSSCVPPKPSRPCLHPWQILPPLQSTFKREASSPKHPQSSNPLSSNTPLVDCIFEQSFMLPPSRIERASTGHHINFYINFYLYMLQFCTLILKYFWGVLHVMIVFIFKFDFIASPFTARSKIKVSSAFLQISWTLHQCTLLFIWFCMSYIFMFLCISYFIPFHFHFLTRVLSSILHIPASSSLFSLLVVPT